MTWLLCHCKRWTCQPWRHRCLGRYISRRRFLILYARGWRYWAHFYDARLVFCWNSLFTEFWSSSFLVFDIVTGIWSIQRDTTFTRSLYWYYETQHCQMERKRGIMVKQLSTYSRMLDVPFCSWPNYIKKRISLFSLRCLSNCVANRYLRML